MTAKREQYVRLERMDVQTEATVAVNAANYFSPVSIIGREHQDGEPDKNPVATEQVFQGRTMCVDDVIKHPDIDIAVIRTREQLSPVPGMAFLRPEVSQKVCRYFRLLVF